MAANTKSRWQDFLREGFISGLGWAFGATVGFALVSFLLLYILNHAGGLPIIGDFIANIVRATQSSLSVRSHYP